MCCKARFKVPGAWRPIPGRDRQGEFSTVLSSPSLGAVAGTGRSRLLLRNLGDHRFGGQHQGRDGGRVLQRRAGHLGRVDDARLHQVFVLVGLRR